jgi:hypothetical protein
MIVLELLIKAIQQIERFRKYLAFSKPLYAVCRANDILSRL